VSILKFDSGFVINIWLFLYHWKNRGVEPFSIAQNICDFVPSVLSIWLTEADNFGAIYKSKHDSKYDSDI